MSSKVILLNETITISQEFRNLSGYEFSLQDMPMYDYDESVRLYSMHFSELEDLERALKDMQSNYDALSTNSKLLVTNYSVLQAAPCKGGGRAQGTHRGRWLGGDIHSIGRCQRTAFQGAVYHIP